MMCNREGISGICSQKYAETSKTAENFVFIANSSPWQQRTVGVCCRQGAISDVVQLVITVMYVFM